MPSDLYAPLQEGSIRLLNLLPGPKEESLRGIISTVSFESAGRYRALSYVWGTVTQSERLWTSTGIVRITPNLKAALQRLRQKEEALELWVDAICINQDDRSLGRLVHATGSCTISWPNALPNLKLYRSLHYVKSNQILGLNRA